MRVQIAKHGDIGSIKVMLNKPHDELIDKMCEATSHFVFQPFRVIRIINGVFIEFSGLPQFDLETLTLGTHVPCLNQASVLPAGTVSLIFNKNGSPTKFSISLKQTTKVDKSHLVIGRVVKGMDVLKAIECYASPGGKPVKEILVNSARVL